MEFKKHLIGTTIYAIPTGNNTLRGAASKKVEFEVVSIARKYVKLTLGGRGEANEYCVTTGATKKSAQGGYAGNGGYLFFESDKACSDFLEQSLLVKSVKNIVIGNHGAVFNGMSIDDLIKIEGILLSYSKA